ncbi:MAG: ACT domain-containing protein, partial [Romboutsia sp.]|nr:ACT domain-containing protein [Romboutsia sp.]
KYIFVQWAEDVEGEFKVELKVDVLNKRGVLATLANALSDCGANIENVHVDEGDKQHNTINFVLHVKNRAHLAEIIRRLRAISIVFRVQRYN